MADQVMIESSTWTPDFRADLAFQKLTEEMVDRMRAYGHDESFPANVVLFTYGDRKVDLFVVLEGEVHACLLEMARPRCSPVSRVSHLWGS